MLPTVFEFLDGPVRQLVTQVYEAVGYLGVALWVAIESVIIQIPSELILPFAGFLVGEGVAIEPLTGAPWNLTLVVLAGTIGATVGGLIAYGIGYWGGRPVIERWGRFLGITPTDLDRTEAFFSRYGVATCFFGRMVPVVRSLVSFGAGLGRMPVLRFTILTFLGSLPWTLLLVVVGVQLGENWEAVGGVLKRFEYAIIGVLVIAVLAFLWVRVVRPWRQRRSHAG
ncbi:MAG: associated Golgi protein-like protein [Chloroflexi bacterium]|nr:associated Golgi protein-like protein [Chloroflexota bacterium]